MRFSLSNVTCITWTSNLLSNAINAYVLFTRGNRCHMGWQVGLLEIKRVWCQQTLPLHYVPLMLIRPSFNRGHNIQCLLQVARGRRYWAAFKNIDASQEERKTCVEPPITALCVRIVGAARVVAIGARIRYHNHGIRKQFFEPLCKCGTLEWRLVLQLSFCEKRYEKR